MPEFTAPSRLHGLDFPVFAPCGTIASLFAPRQTAHGRTGVVSIVADSRPQSYRGIFSLQGALL